MTKHIIFLLNSIPIIRLENAETHKGLYENLLERFSQKNMTPVVQAELSNSCSIDIASCKKGGGFYQSDYFGKDRVVEPGM